MTREVPEADWKVFRQLRDRALERFAEQILGEVAGICVDQIHPPHERYLEVWRVLREHDMAMAGAFDHLSRSRMFTHLAPMKALGLVDAADLSRMSTETQERIRVLTEQSRR